MKFDNATFKAFRNDFQKAVQDIEKKYGIKIQGGNISYGGNSFSMKVEAVVDNGEGGNFRDQKLKEDFERSAILFGFDKKDFGKTFRLNGDTYKIVGLKPRSPKYPVIAKNVVTGQSYKFGAETVKSLIKY